MKNVNFKVGSGKIPAAERNKLEKRLQPYVRILQKAAHDKNDDQNNKWAGIAVFTGKVTNSWDAGVIEPFSFVADWLLLFKTLQDSPAQLESSQLLMLMFNLKAPRL